MERTRTGKAGWIGATASGLYGATAAFAGWVLTVRAREYCVGIDAGSALELNLMLPVLVVGTGLGAVAFWAGGLLLTQWLPVRWRILCTAPLVAVASLWPAWVFFASRGTMDGYLPGVGLCPTSNIPPWWPDWIPA